MVGEASDPLAPTPDAVHGGWLDSAPHGPAEAVPARDGEPDGRTVCTPLMVAVVPSRWVVPLVPPGPPAPPVSGGTA